MRTPGRWTSFLCAVTVVLLLTACGGTASDGSSSATAPPSGTATPTTAVPGVEELDAMLLTTQDVFEGWQVGAPVNEADLADSVQVPCADTAVNPTIVERLRAVTGVQFEPGDGSYRHLIEFATAGDPARLAADLEALFGAIGSCGPEFTGADGQGSGTVQELALGDVGDQRQGYVMTGREAPDSDLVWHVRTAYVRVGSVAITVSLTEILPADDPTPTISDAEFVGVVQAAADRISP